MVADAIAKSRSPVERFRKRAMGNVSVFILVAPASISTAPNSPIAFDQVMVSPAKRACLDMGRLTWKNTAGSDAPRVLATCSYLGWTESKAERMTLMRYGTLTKNWATIIAAVV